MLPVLDRDPAGSDFWWTTPRLSDHCKNLPGQVEAQTQVKRVDIDPADLVDKPFVAGPWSFQVQRGPTWPLRMIRGEETFQYWLGAARATSPYTHEVHALKTGAWKVDWSVTVANANHSIPMSRAQAGPHGGVSLLDEVPGTTMTSTAPIANESYTFDDVFVWD